MVPYQRPIPKQMQRSTGRGESVWEGKSAGAGGKGLIGIWVQAEKLMQIALILPCSVLIGWGIGAWIGHLVHQSWIGIVGVVFGGASGMVYVIRLALEADKDPAMQDEESGAEKKGSEERRQ